VKQDCKSSVVIRSQGFRECHLITTLDTKFCMFGGCLTWPSIPMICICRGHLPQFCPPVDGQQRLVKVGLSNFVVCTHVFLATLVSIICVHIAYGSYQLISTVMYTRLDKNGRKAARDIAPCIELCDTLQMKSLHT
jgi:hypothetical protein